MVHKTVEKGTKVPSMVGGRCDERKPKNSTSPQALKIEW